MGPRARLANLKSPSPRLRPGLLPSVYHNR